uniref:Uncharacterized protein n=1 Tax=Cannabis sativa TaxID=3483 RepID=A0A803QB17_CANSA
MESNLEKGIKSKVLGTHVLTRPPVKAPLEKTVYQTAPIRKRYQRVAENVAALRLRKAVAGAGGRRVAVPVAKREGMRCESESVGFNAISYLKFDGVVSVSIAFLKVSISYFMLETFFFRRSSRLRGSEFSSIGGLCFASGVTSVPSLRCVLGTSSVGKLYGCLIGFRFIVSLTVDLQSVGYIFSPVLSSASVGAFFTCSCRLSFSFFLSVALP